MAKIPSTATGKITAINFGDDEVIPVGHVMVTIEDEGSEEAAAEVDAAVPATAPAATRQVT